MLPCGDRTFLPLEQANSPLASDHPYDRPDSILAELMSRARKQAGFYETAVAAARSSLVSSDVSPRRS
jgi:hypothetical protein